MSYVLAFLGFAALIILHEGGHFIAAKAVGMRVERFSLFFGPLVVKRQIGETLYGIGVIPLGGYVKITGMNPNEDIPLQAVPRAYYNQAVWKRIVTILAGPMVNLLIAFVIVGALLLSIGKPVPSTSVAGVMRGTPAAAVLRPGDRLISVDGVRQSENAIRRQIARHRCTGTPVNGCQAATPAHLTVRRNGRTVLVSVRPRYVASVKRMEIGFEFGSRMVPVGIGTAASGSVSWMWQVASASVSRLVRIFQPQARRQLHSVVGGYTYVQESFTRGTTVTLSVLALISLSLGIINLFPFLPLDGGHIFWAVAEKIRGHRIPFRVMERAGVVGFAVVMLVFVIGLSNDITALTGSGLNLPR